eukprot:12975720-Alexandrium_andersonii.AAC.1
MPRCRCPLTLRSVAGFGEAVTSSRWLLGSEVVQAQQPQGLGREPLFGIQVRRFGEGSPGALTRRALLHASASSLRDSAVLLERGLRP